MSNSRFAEYATSGAFQMSLTRSQISSLSLIAGTGRSVALAGSLERKGLVETIPGEGSNLEARLTGAGGLCLALLAEAGLTNSGANALAGEVDALRRQLAELRERDRETRQRLWAAMARKDAVERENEALRRDLESERTRMRVRLKPGMAAPIISLKDPLPHLTDAQLVEGVEP